MMTNADLGLNRVVHWFHICASAQPTPLAIWQYVTFIMICYCSQRLRQLSTEVQTAVLHTYHVQKLTKALPMTSERIPWSRWSE